MLLFFLLSTVLSSSTLALPLGSISASADVSLTPQSKVFSFVPPFPDSGRKQAILEQPTLVNQKDTAYGRLQEFVATFSNPKPVVDTLQEHEKYGNDGGTGRAVATVIINGVEGFSNFLNAAVDVPQQAAKTIGKQITASLNTLGGKLSGIR